MQVGDTFYGQFTIFQSDGVTPWSGQAGSVSDTLRLNGAVSAQPVTITETGVTGRYYATFTPNSVGFWDLELSNPDGRVIGWSFEAEAQDFDSLSARIPAALVGGRMDSDVGNIQADAVDAVALATDAVSEIRDAILSDSTAFDGADIAAILADTDAIDTRLPSDPADESNQLAQHTATQAAIAALNDLSIADVQTALDNQGYTAVRAALLDNLDASVSSVLTAIGALNDLSQADVQAAMTAQGYTVARAALLDFLDAAVSSRSSHSAADVDTQLSGTHGAGSWESASAVDWTAAEKEQIRFRLAMDGTQTDPTTNTGTIEDILADTAAVDGRLPSDPADESLQQAAHTATQAAIAALNDLSQADVQSALTAQGYTAARAAFLDNLDAAVSAVLTAIGALNDLSQADVQAAMTSQGYTTVRAALLDFLDVVVSSRSSHSAADVDTQLSGGHGAGSWETATGFATPGDAMALTATAEADLVDAVWDEVAADHATAGSTGEALASSVDRRVIQTWADKFTPTAGMYGAVRAHKDGQFTPLPTATLDLAVFEGGVLQYSDSGLTPNAQGYWDLFIDHADVTPAPGTVLVFLATITDGPITIVGASGLSVPEVT